MPRKTIKKSDAHKPREQKPDLLNMIKSAISAESKSISQLARELGFSRHGVWKCIGKNRNSIHIESWNKEGHLSPNYKWGSKRDAEPPEKTSKEDDDLMESNISKQMYEIAQLVNTEVQRSGIVEYMRKKDPLMAALYGRPQCSHRN